MPGLLYHFDKENVISGGRLDNEGKFAGLQSCCERYPFLTFPRTFDTSSY